MVKTWEHTLSVHKSVETATIGCWLRRVQRALTMTPRPWHILLVQDSLGVQLQISTVGALYYTSRFFLFLDRQQTQAVWSWSADEAAILQTTVVGFERYHVVN